MAKVTTKLQVTVPKKIADEYHIRPGDELLWERAGEAIRVRPARAERSVDAAERLRCFDQATARQKRRQRTTTRGGVSSRGWTRDELYERARAR